MNMKYQPKKYMRTDADIIAHIYDVVEHLDGAGLVITDDGEIRAELDNMNDFVCDALRGGLFYEENDELE